MKKVSWIVVIAGAVVGLAAVVLTHLGNPANMGFCIACFLRDITGAVGMHGAAKVQYVRPEIIGLVLGAFIMSVATKEFRAKAGSSPATRFVLGAFVMIGALAFLGCPLRMVLRIGGGDLNAVVGLVGFTLGIFIGIQFLKRGFSLKRAYPVGKGEGGLSGLFDAYAQQEGSDIGNAVAIMYTTAYCGDPTMPAVWLRDSADGHQSTIHLSKAEKDTQQILLLRDGYTFTF